MKQSMNFHARPLLQFGFVLLASLIMLPRFSMAATTAPVGLASSPLANSTTTSVKPNLMFTLDDSGSMASNYTPDWANDGNCKTTSGGYNASCVDQPPFRSDDFNGIYYNPAVNYKPAVNADGTSKASQTSWTSVKNDAYGIQSTSSTNLVTGYTDVEWCTDSTYSDCLRNDNYLLPGTVNGKSYTTSHPSVASTGSGLVATGSVLAPTTATRSWGPHYYTIVAGEYCNSRKLTNCQFTQTATFSYPAKLRWCTSAANATATTPAAGTCQALRTGSFTVARYPTKFFQPTVAYSAAIAAVPATAATAPSNGSLVITNVGKNKPVSISCGGTSIITNYQSANTATVSTKLDELYNNITGKTVNSYVTNCTKTPSSGTTTSVSCSISAPMGASACSGGFSVSNITTSTNTGPAGGANATAGSPYVPEVLAQAAYYPGSFIRTDIVPSITSYPKASTRTDCAGSTCSYNEEMTNFANWWTYYQTRMQAMKSAASRAFKPIDTRFRVGFNSISYTGATDSAKFLHIDDFDLTQKTSWYAKLFASSPTSSTPLRGALSKVGQIFAHKLSGAADPMQYSCQQNFTILSTDGYWNTSLETGTYGPFGLGGSNVGDLDSATTPRQKYQGPTATANTLADVAKYYYDTDLRTPALGNCTGSPVPPATTGNTLCSNFSAPLTDDPYNNVFVAGTDNNTKQHMTTFTMGLGVSGALQYTSDYKTASSGDYYDLSHGAGSPTVYWSVPVADTETAVDDLWHAAVNGEGTYFSAQNPDEIVSGLTSALNAITARLGSGAAAATSTLTPVNGNNFAYVASYTTVDWTGNLSAHTINTSTGVTSETSSWCAENVVADTCAAPGAIVPDVSSGSTVYNCVNGTSSVEVAVACTGTMASTVSATSDTRKIWTKGSNATTLNNFKLTGGDLSAANFNATKLASLSQWSSLTTSQQTAAAGDNIVNFLRGQTGYEDRASNLVGSVDNRLFRARSATLGDTIESQPAYNGSPTFSYTDSGYSGFKAAQSSRPGTVYVGANDGMMHAFDASNGVERWAYVPTMVIPNMWALADKNYSTNHAYYVNGSPTISDIYDGSWKTILVAGLNGGGRGYYALDITDPTTPKLLWEFTPTNDANLGYTFGKPVITKKANGDWVVLITSGYNNIPDASPRVKYPLINTGDGKGYLYVLNASTGAMIGSPIGTGAGSTAIPSGLAQISAWADDAEKNNTATFVYGGDLLGNLWRFDINAGTVMNFATLQAGTSAQPITTRPQLGTISTSDGKAHRVVYVGTGKYLETSDLTDTQQQTLYAIKDDDATATLVNPRSSTGTGPDHMVQQTLTTSGGTRTASSNPVNLLTDRGWFVDFPAAGERDNVPSELVLGTLIVPTNVPTNTVCAPGGTSWKNSFDYKTGGAVSGSGGIVSTIGNSLIVGINILYIVDPITGKLKPIGSVVTADHPTPEVIPIPFSNSGSGFQKKRVIWRELIK